MLHRLAPERVVLSGVPVWAPVAYTGPARDLVRALKFRGAAATADAMAAQIVANMPAELLGAAAAGSAPAGPALVPVPLHPRRQRRRGYNQAGLIAAALAGRTGLELVDCLARAGPAAPQVGRDRRERRAGPAGSVRVRSAAAPARALLVDDVATTGATLAACAAALRSAGAVEVAAVTFARTIGR
jgi:ComF family protein